MCSWNVNHSFSQLSYLQEKHPTCTFMVYLAHPGTPKGILLSCSLSCRNLSFRLYLTFHTSTMALTLCQTGMTRKGGVYPVEVTKHLEYLMYLLAVNLDVSHSVCRTSHSSRVKFTNILWPYFSFDIHFKPLPAGHRYRSTL